MICDVDGLSEHSGDQLLVFVIIVMKQQQLYC